MAKNFFLYFSIFLLGGSIYITLETLWRGYTHISMFFAGGLATSILFIIYTTFAYNYPLLLKCLIGSVVITSIEFIIGLIVNVYLKLNVWDYSLLPFNILGQVSLYFSVIWFFLCIFIVMFSNMVVKLL